MRHAIKSNNCMVVSIILLITFLLQPLGVFAQSSETQQRNIEIIFIDHEPSLPARDMIAYIRKRRAAALENDNSLVIYVPNNQNPLISLTNIPDPVNHRDRQEAFDNICEALNLPSHIKEPLFIRYSIMNLFSDYGIIDARGNILYSLVRMDFYLTSEFWKLGYNETIIAPIFYALDGINLLKQNVRFDVYVNPDDRPTYNPDAPFGKNNLGNVNKLVNIYDYDF